MRDEASLKVIMWCYVYTERPHRTVICQAVAQLFLHTCEFKLPEDRWYRAAQTIGVDIFLAYIACWLTVRSFHPVVSFSTNIIFSRTRLCQPERWNSRLTPAQVFLWLQILSVRLCVRLRRGATSSTRFIVKEKAGTPQQASKSSRPLSLFLRTLPDSPRLRLSSHVTIYSSEQFQEQGADVGLEHVQAGTIDLASWAVTQALVTKNMSTSHAFHYPEHFSFVYMQPITTSKDYPTGPTSASFSATASAHRSGCQVDQHRASPRQSTPQPGAPR